MHVGILGSGTVAQTLASGFLTHGHAVTMGTRDAGKLADWLSKNPAGRVGSTAEAAAFGKVIVLAVKGDAAAKVLQAAGADNLAGKTIMDACNPIEEVPPVNGILKFFTTLDDSLMERLQREFRAAHFVKAFSCVGAGQMVDPSFSGGKPTMFICGNEEGAKQEVRAILDEFGWETADMGKVESARAIEPLCILWCARGFLENKWNHAFKLLT